MLSLSIPLTRGKETVVDANRDDLLKYKWNLSYYGYAVRHKPKQQGGIIYLHREIMDAQPGEDVDHINGNKLDNRSENLRICTRAQNLLNKPVRKDSKSGIKGVRAVRFRKGIRWQARLASKHLGYFDTSQQAADAYDTAAVIQFGDYVQLNKKEIIT